MEVRLSEHKNAVRKKDVKNACYKHHASSNHEIDWNASRIIYVSDDWYQRLVVESSCIVSMENHNNMRSTLAIDKFSANIILSSCKNIHI